MGTTILQPMQSLKFLYDWAGPDNDDFYQIEGFDEKGQRVNLKGALHVDEQSGWISCLANRSKQCEWNTLNLQMGQTR